MSVKSGWTRVAFGDVVRKVHDRVAPEESGLERYVAGEHMDTDDFRIRRWGRIGDGYLGPAFHMRFKPGQVLYGSRRTYLRKVAVADFEGITANTTFVLESKDSRVLLPELLPFLMHTEAFHEHAIKQSKGSVNPYINFSDLTWFEFPLPPLDEQRRIVRCLMSAQSVVEALENLSSAAFTLARATDITLLVGMVPGNGHQNIEDVRLPVGWRLVPASSICAAPVISGVTPSQDDTQPDSACPFIKVGNLTFDGRLETDTLAHLGRGVFERLQSLHVVPGDVLTNIVGPPLGKVSVVPSSLTRALINQAIVRYRPIDSSIRAWLTAYLMSPWAKNWLFARSKKTSGQRNINATTCASLPVPLPPSKELNSLVARLGTVTQQAGATHARAKQAASILKAVISQSVHP